MSNAETIQATEIRKGDTVTLPSGRVRRVLRAHTFGQGFVDLIVVALDGHVVLKPGTTVVRHS